VLSANNGAPQRAHAACRVTGVGRLGRSRADEREPRRSSASGASRIRSCRSRRSRSRLAGRSAVTSLPWKPSDMLSWALRTGLPLPLTPSGTGGSSPRGRSTPIAASTRIGTPAWPLGRGGARHRPVRGQADRHAGPQAARRWACDERSRSGNVDGVVAVEPPAEEAATGARTVTVSSWCVRRREKPCHGDSARTSCCRVDLRTGCESIVTVQVSVWGARVRFRRGSRRIRGLRCSRLVRRIVLRSGGRTRFR